METVELIYIGEKFYFESNTVMSSIYTTRGERYDWGFMQRDLANNKSIHIRPATKEEILVFEGKLLSIKDG